MRNYIELWRALLRPTGQNWAVFTHGTCVVLGDSINDYPWREPAERAKSLLLSTKLEEGELLGEIWSCSSVLNLAEEKDNRFFDQQQPHVTHVEIPSHILVRILNHARRDQVSEVHFDNDCVRFDQQEFLRPPAGWISHLVDQLGLRPPEWDIHRVNGPTDVLVRLRSGPS